MEIASAIRVNKLLAAQPTTQQLTDYVNAVIIINNYAFAITNQLLPTFTYPPDNYAQFATKFQPAQTSALNWTSNLFVTMTGMPTSISQGAASLFTAEEGIIEGWLGLLIKDPTNTNAQQQLATALKTAQKVVQNQVTSISGLQTALQEFTTQIATAATALTDLATLATQGAGNEQQAIGVVNGEITQLNKEISAAQTLLTVSEIGIGLSVFIAIVGACLLAVPGGQVAGGILIAGGVVGLGASIAGTVLENKEISALQGKVSADQDQISDRNKAITTLNALSGQFTALHNSNMQAQTSLATVVGMWNQLDAAIEEVNTELTAVGTDTTSAQYQQALTDFQAAEANWTEVVAFATALAGLNFHWQDNKGTWHNYTDQAPGLNDANITVNSQAA